MAWPAEATFFLLAAAAQCGLGIAIAVRRPRVEWALVLAAIFLGNGALAVNSLLQSLGVGPWADTGIGSRVFFDLDRTVTLLIAYLALAYPHRPAWARRPWVLPVLFLAVWASVLVPRALGWPTVMDLPAALAPEGCADPCERWTWLRVWTYQATTIGFLLLIVRWAYLLPRTRSPIELAHLRLLFAAFAVRAVHVELLVHRGGPFALLVAPDAMLAADPLRWAYYARGALALAAIAATLVLLLRHRTQLASDRRRAVDFVLAFVVLGVVEAFLALDDFSFSSASGRRAYLFGFQQHLDVLVLRPALVVYAMLRYDFLGSWAQRRRGIVALVAALASVGYATGLHAGVASAFSPAVAWTVTVPLAIGLGVLTALLLHSVVSPLRNPGAERYVALLEDLYRNGQPSPAQLEALDRERRALGVDPAEAEALRDAVASRWTGDTLWLPGQRIAGRYELRRLLGSGGWGEVYLADDHVEGRPVVLKRTRSLAPLERKALLAEAYALTRLSHPDLVPLLRTEVVEGEPVLVLEHMPGGTLAARLESGPLTAEERDDLAQALLRGLTAVHQAGLVHGDVKPGNVLLDRNGHHRLGDFGLARPAAPAIPRLGEPTPSLRPGGTVRYLAPEQADGAQPTQAGDVYAAGVVLLQAVTGTHPLPEGVPEYELRRRLAEEPVRVPAAAGSWRPLLQAMLAREPARRPTAAQALRDAVSLRGTAAASARRPARPRT